MRYKDDIEEARLERDEARLERDEARTLVRLLLSAWASRPLKSARITGLIGRDGKPISWLSFTGAGEEAIEYQKPPEGEGSPTGERPFGLSLDLHSAEE